GCVHPPVTDGTPCPDATVCNGNETCRGGVCVPGISLVCADNGNPCTNDICDPVNAYEHPAVADGTPCPDANSCDGDELCLGGFCQPGHGPCPDDNNPCTLDTCDAVLGCQHTPVTDGTPCADADVCNGAETCQAGTCTPGTPLVCADDGNPCTNDICDPVAGCVHPPVTDGTACPDPTGRNGGETCQSGTCVPGSPLICADDGNPCTNDICDPVNGCVHPPVSDGTPCPDSDLCNGDETCQAGTCAPGTPLVCVDDGNPCTND